MNIGMLLNTIHFSWFIFKITVLSVVLFYNYCSWRNTEIHFNPLLVFPDTHLLKVFASLFILCMFVRRKSQLLYLLQEQIMKVLAADEVKQYVGGPLLRPEELVELCLKSENPELSLLAFDVFAWTSSSFRKSHRHLLEDCWKNAANQDDWGQLYQASIDEGWSDEETLQQLRDTLLFQASNRCYGPNAETIDEGFEEVLPLREGDSEDQILNDSSSSVEAILKQHKDFPFAGKLMLTAVMLGSVQDDVKVDDSPSPME